MLPVLTVFSHLRWSRGESRPQHLFSRLSGRWRVVFIEEPRHTDGPPALQSKAVDETLTVLVPHTPVAAPGFHDDQIAAVLQMLLRHLAAEGLRVDVAWLTTPMALPLAQALHPGCMAYDCMDELAAWHDAPRQLAQRESGLLKQAALVFTSGPSLYESRRGHHPGVHCLPNAVDALHFAPAADRRAAALQPAPTRPHLGFHGLIDQRIDLDLVLAVADRHLDWSVTMAGPLSGLAHAALPRRPNLRWLGEQRYEDLPALLAGWDLALMPFTLDDATRNSSPMQTLEYLAADVPVVCTALRDVEWLYGEAVTLAGPGAAAFVETCELTLAETPAQRYRRAAAAMSVVAMHSWSRNADTVHDLLMRALHKAADAEPPPLRVAAGGRRA